MLVYVLNKEGNPLMPTKPAVARLLLKDGNAKVIRRQPFTIKMLVESKNYKQKIIAGMDTGSKVIGCAAISNGKVLYQSETLIRQDISQKMEQRKMYRRTRRNRKTRYRKPRFCNRCNSITKNRLAPSVKSKVDSHLREKRFIESILPISEWKLETASFDIYKISNPDIENLEYRDGNQKGFYNVKAYILNRDNYTCQKCKCKSKDNKLRVHHIIFRSNGGTNSPDNLITLCSSCHKKLHDGKFEIKGIKSKTKHATEIGIIKSQLKKQFGNFVETFGYETKFKREQILILPKTHYNDAVAICCDGIGGITSLKYYFIKRNISRGDYQQHKGKCSEKKIPTGKVLGFRKFDKVKFLGKEYFIKGRMSTEYCILMDIDGNKIDLKPIPKFSKMKRITSRKSWIIDQKIIVNFC